MVFWLSKLELCQHPDGLACPAQVAGVLPLHANVVLDVTADATMRYHSCQHQAVLVWWPTLSAQASLWCCFACPSSCQCGAGATDGRVHVLLLGTPKGAAGLQCSRADHQPDIAAAAFCGQVLHPSWSCCAAGGLLCTMACCHRYSLSMCLSELAKCHRTALPQQGNIVS